MQFPKPVFVLATALIPSVAMAQTVAEVAAPTVTTVLTDFDLLPPGVTTVAAIQGAGPGSSIGNITLTPNAAAAGVYNTNANEQALGLDAAGTSLEILDTSGTAAFTAFDAQIDLLRPCTEIGFGVGDWNGPMIIDFYLAGTLQTTFTSTGYSATSLFKYFQMTGGTFDRIDVRASTTTGNWCFIDFETEPANGIFANFTATPSSGPSPLTVAFSDATFTSDPGGVVAWQWDFDSDGTIDSTNQNDSFVYGACGSYDVTLTSTDAGGNQSTVTVVGAVLVDDIDASFTVSNVGPGVWLFTDTSTPGPATAWAWDFDGDGTVDDTNQIGTYIDPSASPFLSLPTCTFTVTGPGGCLSDTIVQSVSEVAGATRVESEVNGGNGTSATPSVGTYFDITVNNADGLNILAIESATYTFAGQMDVSIYITNGTHVGKEGNANEWILAATGSGTATGSGLFTAPELVLCTLSNSFYLPPGNYGCAVYNTDPNGGLIQVAYTNGPAASPYGNADLTFHPNGVGCSSTSLLGPCAFQPRLFNGAFYYEVCATTGNASAGPYATGCPNSAAVVPTLELNTLPTIGGTYSLDVDAGLGAPAAVVVVTGLSKDLYNGLPLPLDLGVVGAPGCNLAASVDLADVVIAGPGPATWQFAVPNNPVLQCFKLYNQAAVLDQAANSFGFVLSNAVAGVCGN